MNRTVDVGPAEANFLQRVPIGELANHVLQAVLPRPPRPPLVECQQVIGRLDVRGPPRVSIRFITCCYAKHAHHVHQTIRDVSGAALEERLLLLGHGPSDVIVEEVGSAVWSLFFFSYSSPRYVYCVAQEFGISL